MRTHFLPSQSLPAVRNLSKTPEHGITVALQGLQELYCPLRLPATLNARVRTHRHLIPQLDLVKSDSGYASRDEVCVSDSEEDASASLQIVRADEFERSFSQRWLTALISRIDTLLLSETTRDCILDGAAFILASFSDSTTTDEDLTLIRRFAFPVCLQRKTAGEVRVELQDAPLSVNDHTDVGLQSWGASIILSELLCSSPERFDLLHTQDQKVSARIIELGAGTGLVSLTLAKLFPTIGLPTPLLMATDYHSAVLENLRSNIAKNADEDTKDSLPVQVAMMDWSNPSRSAPFDIPADILVAADVVYAPEHAIWLRDCAAGLLSPQGSFWLIVTIRTEGKFRGIADTVEAAFARDDKPKISDGRSFEIAQRHHLEKKKGIGRGDESGYLLYKIAWI